MRYLEQLQDFWQGLDSRARLKAGYVLIGVLVIVMGWSLLAGKCAQLEHKRKAREAVLRELLPLKTAYRSAKQSSDLLLGRLAAVRPDDSPAKIIDEIGIRGKGVKIASLKGEERAGLLEDAADARIEGLTFNEALNLIYRLEKGGRPLLLKKANLRVRFDDPARCDLALTVALLKPSPGSAR